MAAKKKNRHAQKETTLRDTRINMAVTSANKKKWAKEAGKVEKRTLTDFMTEAANEKIERDK